MASGSFKSHSAPQPKAFDENVQRTNDGKGSFSDRLTREAVPLVNLRFRSLPNWRQALTRSLYLGVRIFPVNFSDGLKSRAEWQTVRSLQCRSYSAVSSIS